MKTCLSVVAIFIGLFVSNLQAADLEDDPRYLNLKENAWLLSDVDLIATLSSLSESVAEAAHQELERRIGDSPAKAHQALALHCATLDFNIFESKSELKFIDANLRRMRREGVSVTSQDLIRSCLRTRNPFDQDLLPSIQPSSKIDEKSAGRIRLLKRLLRAGPI